MPGNTFGTIFRLTSFGESHGGAVGGIIDGCPAGLPFDPMVMELMMSRRRPGQSVITSSRKEPDHVKILSGIFEGRTTGTPIGFIIENKDQRPRDYEPLRDKYRPSHADYTYEQKYGLRDHRGGGRSSARETAVRVAAGAIAKQLLAHSGIDVKAWTESIGPVTALCDPDVTGFQELVYQSPTRCPASGPSAEMETLLMELKERGDTTGGVVACAVNGVPAGLGEPVFDKLNADLAKAMFSINAVKGFEIGSGFSAASMKGSEHNDPFIFDDGEIRTEKNNSGGIQGGLSNGEKITMRTAFKPVSTILQEQDTVDNSGNRVKLEMKGRHDPCVVPRAVVVVDAMVSLVIADHMLRNRSSKI